MRPLEPYLQSSEHIDWDNPAVVAQADQLRSGPEDIVGIVQSCYEWVRDNIQHSGDFNLAPVTCRASDVLKTGSGLCYAKSHLLAALLRANRIPAGLCYQRLALDDLGTRFCLHGLNAVYVDPFGWIRLDARGNRLGIDAQFNPFQEQLAFTARLPGELDFPEVWPEPLSVVTAALLRHLDCRILLQELPDIEIWNPYSASAR